MATIRKLRGRWQAQVRRRGMKPRAKSFASKAEAEKWARDLETQVDRFGMAPNTKILETKKAKALARWRGGRPLPLSWTSILKKAKKRGLLANCCRRR